MNWTTRSTVWTDGSRFDTGEAGAACVWKREDGSWTGRRFHLGANKDVFDAEVFAIYQALKALRPATASPSLRTPRQRSSASGPTPQDQDKGSH